MSTRTSTTHLGAALWFALGALILAGCCPNGNCPPAPLITDPKGWQGALEEGDYDAVAQGTAAVIAKGRSADYYAEAHLYRGIAELARGGEAKVAQADLDVAEKLRDELTTIDKTQEQTLLFRGQMVAHLKLDDIRTAERFRDMALELSPSRADLIQQEFRLKDLRLEPAP